MTMRSKKPIAALSSSLVSTFVNSSIASVHGSSYTWPNFSASLVGRLSSFKSAISGLLEVNLDPAILLSLSGILKKISHEMICSYMCQYLVTEVTFFNIIITFYLILIFYWKYTELRGSLSLSLSVEFDAGGLGLFLFLVLPEHERVSNLFYSFSFDV